MKKLQSHSEIKWVFAVQISSCHGQICSFPVQESMTSLKVAGTPPPPPKTHTHTHTASVEGLQQKQRELNSSRRIWVKNKINTQVPFKERISKDQEQEMLLFEKKSSLVLLRKYWWIVLRLRKQFGWCFSTSESKGFVLMLDLNFFGCILYFIGSWNATSIFSFIIDKISTVV